MAASLPIACSNYEPMSELLGNAGLYFNPEQPESITAALTRLIQDNTLRKQNALTAYQRSQDYSWELCSQNTFEFISKTARWYTKYPDL
jgi:glycosyltransferase involved in cell wall biosynthesis